MTAVAAAALMLVAGCNSSGDQADESTSTTSVWSPTSTPGATGAAGETATDGVVEMPLDAYQVIGDAQGVVGAAHELLVEQCMRAQGFDYERRAEASNPPQRIGVSDEAYGLSEFADAAKVGYTGADWNERIAQLQEGQQARDEASPAFLEALTGSADPLAAGSEPAGCIGDATAELNGDQAPSDDVFAVVGQIGVDAAAKTRSDPKVLDGFAAWSACMAKAGYTFSTPSEPAKSVPQVVIDINNLEAVPPPSGEEVSMALADQTCKREVALFDTWVEAESRHQREGIAANEAVLTDYKAAIDRRVSAARRVLEGGEAGG
jgi:hypothetical protein